MMQTLRDYMHNPSGKGSMVIPNRQLIIDDLTSRYHKLISEKKITMKVLKKGDEYFILLKIPSESKDKKVEYDVVLNFVMLDEDFSKDVNLNRYFVKFFSNCPSFTYTYAYAYDSEEMLVNELDEKYGSQVMENAPIVRNPSEVIMFEKSLYFACLHLISDSAYTSKLYLNSIAKRFSVKALKDEVRNIDKIKIENELARQEAKKKRDSEKSPMGKFLKDKKIIKNSSGNKKVSNTVNKITAKTETGKTSPKKTTAKKTTAKRSTVKKR